MTHAHTTNRPTPASLYKRDLYAWVQEQVHLLRSGRVDEVDAENIAEEISDVGHNEYDKLESALRVLLAHMLKWITSRNGARDRGRIRWAFSAIMRFASCARTLA